MPIQIPKVQSESPVATAQNPRVEAPALNVEAPMERQQTALEGVGKEVIRYRDQIANQEADNMATDRDNQLQDWYKKRVNGDPTTGKVGLFYEDGDPRDNYNRFAKEAQDKLDELSSAPKDSDWSGLTQNVVNRRLNKRAQELQGESLTQYGHEKYKYDTALTNANEDFAYKALPGVAAQVEPGRPETFGPLQAKLNDMVQPRVQNALQYGGAVKTDDGSIIKTPALTKEIADKVSKALYATIDNLYNSDVGDGVAISKADAIKQQFGDQMNPFHKDAADTKAKAAVLKQKSLQLAQVIMQKGPNAPEIAEAPLEVRQDAAKFANEYQRQMEQMTDRKQKKNYEIAAKYVDQTQQSDTPLPGVMALKNDPNIIPVWNQMSAKQQQTLEAAVTSRKVTSPGAQQQWLKLVTNQDPDGKTLAGMSAADLMHYTAGMKDSDKKAAMNTWTKMNSQTGPQLQQQYTAFGKEFDQQAIGAKLLHKIAGSNLLTAEDQIREPQLKKELLDSIDGLGNMGPKERSDYVAKFVASKVTGTAFAPPARKTFNGSSQNPPPASASTPPTQAPPGTESAPPLKGAAAYYGNLTEAAKQSWIQKFRQAPENGGSNGKLGAAPSTDKLMKFIDKETAK